jgi:putative oxygen-independent coproporphyrinogen III oxidase
MVGLYVHVPYCSVRCSYCDFYLVPGRGRRFDEYVAALCGEIDGSRPPLRGLAADTVHFGGGTPSLLAPPLLGRILRALGSAYPLCDRSEIALEANPEDVDRARLEAWSGLGVTRLTVGVQSLDDRLLALMRRPHGARRALEALEEARRLPRVSLGADLILGLPGQDPGEALRGVARVADSGVDHLSLYLLELHDRTRLGREMALGRRQAMDPDAAAAVYEDASLLLAELGFEHYEISNFARPGHRSRHNLKYWTDGEYLGFGPSAHSYARGRRWSNPADLDLYIAQRGQGIEPVDDPQPRAGRAAEALFAGLRLLEGVDLEALKARYGEGVPSAQSPPIAFLRAAGLVDLEGQSLRLTRRGRLLSNEVFERLLPSAPVS